MLRALLVVLLLVSACMGFAAGGEFWVAPDGDDTNPGTLDEPFATITRAQKAVRAVADRDAPVTVWLRGGRHELDATLTLGPEDSGAEDAPVIYQAWQDEEPVISGGRVVDGWRVANGRWQATLPQVRDGDWYFSQLWVNGQRRYRPRWPQNGYSYIAAAVPSVGDAEATGDNRFRFDRGDIRADWHNRGDVEMLIFHNWSMSRLPIEDVDEAKRVVTFGGRTWHSDIAALDTRRRYIAENVFEALDEPGEWYLDRQTGVLTYIPMPGETPQNTQIIAPRLEQLVSIKGDPELGLEVQDVVFRNLTFEHTNANMPGGGYSVAQAEVGARSTGGKNPLFSAIEAMGARGCAIDRCEVRHVGYYAMEFGYACHNNAISDCEMWDLGGGGVKAGSTRFFPQPDERQASGLTVQDCLIAHGGRIHPAAVGVWVGNSGDNNILHNDIHDLYYTGISVGWRWGYGYSAAKRNLIDHNHIWDIGQRRLSDLGGIYTLGESQGTVLSYNRIHDISRVEYGGSGIYFDQATTGILVENNLTYRTQDAGFTVHFAKDNVATNNIFAYGENITVGLGRMDLSGPVRFERNVVAWKQGTLTQRIEAREDFHFDYNLYWPGNNEPFTIANDKSLEEWRALGNDVNSIVADPLFVDPDNGDFSLKPDSPATKIGFKPFRMDDIGRRTDARRYAQAPEVPHAYPVAGLPPARSIDIDFEWSNPGEKAPGARTYENNETETARVTNEKAKSGELSIKLMDGPGEPTYNPHIFYDPGFKSGMLTDSFDIWLEPGASLSHEWRNGASRYQTGPSIVIRPDGTLLASGKQIMTVPHNEWVHIAITSGMGEQVTGAYSLTVELASGEATTVDDLPCDPECKELRWLGWVAAAAEPVAIYIDNIKLEPVKSE